MSSVVPDGWEAKELGDIATFSGGSAFKEMYQGENSGKHPFIKVSDMNLPENNRYIVQANNWVSEEIRQQAKIKLFPSDSVVFAKVGAALLLNRRRQLVRETAIDNNMMAAIPNTCDHNFLYYSMQRIDLANIVQSGAVPSVNQSQMESIPTITPPLPEQKKIASILTSVDEVIENTQKQIDKLQDLKKATMNELLTTGIGHTEFKDSELGRIPKSWEVGKVSDYLQNMTSGWSPDCLTEPAINSQWGVLKTTAVTWDGFNVSENKALPKHLEGRPTISLNKGDVLVTRAGPIDRVGVVAFCSEAYPRIMLSDKIIRIQSKRDKLSGEFLSIWLSSHAAQRNIRAKMSGMAESQSNISQDILKSVPMPIPDIFEQTKIAAIMKALTQRICVANRCLKQTESLKKSLMQDLLTGKVRVTVN